MMTKTQNLSENVCFFLQEHPNQADDAASFSSFTFSFRRAKLKLSMFRLWVNNLKHFA